MKTRLALGVLRDVVRQMSVLPGRRMVVLASPGFLGPNTKQDRTDIIDRATHASVIISTLDARGIYTVGLNAEDGAAASNPSRSALFMQYETAAASLQNAVLAEMAEGTGGTLFKRVAARPEYYYVLGFSPQNLKLDGKFHALKVTLKEPAKLALQVRRGYYAPTHLEDAVHEAERAIEEALFSKEEIHELAVGLHTQFFRTGDADAKLAVMIHVDLKQMKFVKVEGRNGNVLRVVAGLFDHDGKYLTATEKVAVMRIRDGTLPVRRASGITVKTSFDVKPGSCGIRLVARDQEGQLMAAENGSVEIP